MVNHLNTRGNGGALEDAGRAVKKRATMASDADDPLQQEILYLRKIDEEFFD